MKVLIWYYKELKINNIIPSNKIKQIDQTNFSTENIFEKNVIVPWITIEIKNDLNYFNDFLKDINFFKERFKTNKIILVPFAHLTEKIAPRDVSFNIILKLKEFLKENKYEVSMAHFGSYKDVLIDCPADEYQIVHRSYPLKNFKDNFKFK